MQKVVYYKLLFLFFSLEVLDDNKLSGQSIHFSQAFGAHLTLNPANTGRFNGDWRAVAMHRHQGYRLSNDFQTSYFSFEYPVYINNERLNTGFFYSRDNSSGNSLPVDRFNVSLANSIRLGYRSHLNAGLQIAWVHMQLNYTGLTFPDQYNRETGGFDPGMPTADMFDNVTTSYLDAGFGLLYAVGGPRGSVSAGYSMQQVNRPGISFLQGRRELSLKHVFHSKADINVDANIFIIPVAVYLYTGGASTSLVGFHLGHNLGEWLNGSFNNVTGGVHLRNAYNGLSRSLVFSAGVTWQYWSFMLSRDSDISTTGTGNLLAQGLELTVSYKLPSTKINRVTMPWERY